MALSSYHCRIKAEELLGEAAELRKSILSNDENEDIMNLKLHHEALVDEVRAWIKLAEVSKSG